MVRGCPAFDVCTFVISTYEYEHVSSNRFESNWLWGIFNGPQLKPNTSFVQHNKLWCGREDGLRRHVRTVAPLVYWLVYSSFRLCRKNKVHCISRFQIYHGRSSRDQCMLFHPEASDIICLLLSIPHKCIIVVEAFIPNPPPLHVRCVSPKPDMSVRPLPWITLTLGSIRNLSISGTFPTCWMRSPTNWKLVLHRS